MAHRTLSSFRPDVAILIPSLAGGGAERVAFFAAEALHERGWKVDLVAAVGKGALADVELRGPRKVILGAVTEILALPHYVRYLHRARPRLVIAMVHTAKLTAALGSLFAPKIPFVASIHVALVKPAELQWWFRRWFGLWPERVLYRRAAHFHAVSHGLATEARRVFQIEEDRISAIYNPLLPHHSEPAKLPKLAARNRDDDFRALAVGRLVPQKDFATLLRAFAKWLHEPGKKSARLTILGEGGEREALMALCDQLGISDRVAMPGFVPNPYDYMRQADVVLLSSQVEGFALVILDALTIGVPVISTDCPYGPAELLGNGRFGKLVPVGDPSAIAAALSDLPSPADPVELAEHLRAFSPERIADAYEQMVISLIGPKTRSTP